MSQYKILDDLIVEAIRTNDPRGPLYAINVSCEAARIAQASGRDSFRIVDQRIQALRKAGTIRFATKAEAQSSGGRLRPGWNLWLPGPRS